MEVFLLQQQQTIFPVLPPPQANSCSIFPLSAQQFQLPFQSKTFLASPLLSSNPRLNPSSSTKYSKWDSNVEKMSWKRFKDEEDDERRSRRKNRRWWSVDFDDELSDENVGFLKEAFDSIWIFKVFRSYGWTLPFVIMSLLLATGPKAFLLSMALCIGQSVLTLALRKLFGGRRRSKSTATRRKYSKKLDTPLLLRLLISMFPFLS